MTWPGFHEMTLAVRGLLWTGLPATIMIIHCTFVWKSSRAGMNAAASVGQ